MNLELPTPPRLAAGVILLGAGHSRRMGQPKLLLPWGNTTVLGYLIHQWQGLGADQVAVVCAAADPVVPAELERLRFPPENRIFNPAPEQGMFSSIQSAARWPGWKPGLTHWVIALGDQPHLNQETLRAVLELGKQHPDKICQPARGGRPRHPVLLPKAAFQELADCAAATLQEFLASRETALGESNDPGLDLDIDRPEDYRRARELVEPNPEVRNPKLETPKQQG